MKLFWEFMVLTVFLGIMFYILYIQGYMITGSKGARKFFGANGKNSFRAAMTSCNGDMKRVVRFQESKTYQFAFWSELTDGRISAELLDAKKNPILHLEGENASGSVDIDKKKRYYLVYNFTGASGEFELKWE